MRWEPMHGLERMRERMNRVFDEAFASFPFWGEAGRRGFWEPDIDVYEDGDNIVVTADVPGVDPNDMEVTVTDQSVVLKGEIKRANEVQERGFYRSERRYGSFYRTIALPAAVKSEAAEADYQNGVLKITAPKKVKDGGQRKLDIRVH